MSQKFKDLKKEITSNFSWAATSFYNIAMQRYSALEEYRNLQFQPAVANFSISVELILKAYISKYAFSKLYVNLPQELELYLHYPNNFDSEEILNRHLPELKSFSYFKTIELGKAVSIFFDLEPDLKEDLSPFLKDLNEVRNPGVHSILPSFQKYEVERIAYAATKIFKYFYDNHEFMSLIGFWGDRQKEILQEYENEVIEIVESKVNKAKKEAKNINEVEPPEATLEKYIINCPVCNNKATLFGETKIKEEDEDKPLEEKNLWFHAEKFKCDYCNLYLENYFELIKAGLYSVNLRNDNENFRMYFLFSEAEKNTEEEN